MDNSSLKLKIIDWLKAIEARPEMYGSVKEVESQHAILVGLLLTDDQHFHHREFCRKLETQLCGPQMKLSLPFSYQIRNDDYKLLVSYLTLVRKSYNLD